jgi:hypothetical protein
MGGGGRRGGTGRQRLENISWTVVIIGVITFLYVSTTLRTCDIVLDKSAIMRIVNSRLSILNLNNENTPIFTGRVTELTPGRLFGHGSEHGLDEHLRKPASA